MDTRHHLSPYAPTPSAQCPTTSLFPALKPHSVHPSSPQSPLNLRPTSEVGPRLLRPFVGPTSELPRSYGEATAKLPYLKAEFRARAPHGLNRGTRARIFDTDEGI
ncbi:MAG: hypothetical protein MJZ77_03335 [Bacteroidales bacterium]|nr:hypothetical protein [Bacteroidales bacterium]